MHGAKGLSKNSSPIHKVPHSQSARTASDAMRTLVTVLSRHRLTQPVTVQDGQGCYSPSPSPISGNQPVRMPVIWRAWRALEMVNLDWGR